MAWFWIKSTGITYLLPLRYKLDPLGKAKVKLSLCLTKHHTMKTSWKSGVINPRILDLGTSWRELSSSRPGRFTPRKRTPGTHWIGGWGAMQRVMAAKLTRLTHKIAIKLRLVAESCTICSSRSRRPVRKLLDTPSYVLPFCKRIS
jgi:hypothetical protein